MDDTVSILLICALLIKKLFADKAKNLHLLFPSSNNRRKRRQDFSLEFLLFLTRSFTCTYPNRSIINELQSTGECWQMFARGKQTTHCVSVSPPGTIHAVRTSEDVVGCDGHSLIPQVMDRFVNTLCQIEMDLLRWQFCRKTRESFSN